MGRYRNNIIDWLIKKRTTFGWIFFILVAILGKGNKRYILYGLPFIITGELIRIISSGTIKKNEVLTKEGIYSFCRNPLYFGSFLISLGFSIASKNIFIWLYFIIFFPLIYYLTIKYEEKFLFEKFGNEYLEYKKSVPSFIPFFKKKNIFKNFSFVQLKRNDEIQNIVVIILLIVFLLIKANKKF